MGKRKSIGLPGRPNEFVIDITQYIYVDGYRNDSPDKTNPIKFIPTGNKSMKDVDFPIMGVDNLGNSQMMMPENEYQFPGDMVMETPMAQNGIEEDNTKGVIPNQKNVDNSFQRKWLESPMYNKILANEADPNDDAEFITNSRIDKLQNVPIIVNPRKNEDEDVGATSWSVNGEMEFLKPSHTNHEGHI